MKKRALLMLVFAVGAVGWLLYFLGPGLGMRSLDLRVEEHDPQSTPLTTVRSFLNECLRLRGIIALEVFGRAEETGARDGNVVGSLGRLLGLYVELSLESPARLFQDKSAGEWTAWQFALVGPKDATLEEAKARRASAAIAMQISYLADFAAGRPGDFPSSVKFDLKRQGTEWYIVRVEKDWYAGD